MKVKKFCNRGNLHAPLKFCVTHVCQVIIVGVGLRVIIEVVGLSSLDSHQLLGLGAYGVAKHHK